MLGLRVHACFLDKECQKFGAPKRLYVSIPCGSLIVGERTQGWIPFYGYAGFWGGWGWWPIVWHPGRE